MWLGEQITARGIGNGISLIIFAGIVANLPFGLASMLELGRTGPDVDVLDPRHHRHVARRHHCIVFVERAQRRLLIQYPQAPGRQRR